LRFTTTASTTATGEMSDETSQHLELSEVETICRNALSASGLNPSATAAIREVVTAAERDGCNARRGQLLHQDSGNASHEDYCSSIRAAALVALPT